MNTKDDQIQGSEDRFDPTGVASAHPLDLDYIRTNIPCQWACPAITDVPGYIQAVHGGDYGGAYVINRHHNLFPGVLGRICSKPCETACRHGESDLGEPVGICHLKRAAADNTSRDYPVAEHMFAQTGKTVGIVGAGPAGLATAHSLALFGHRVTVYEAMPKLGGMLLYGIPDFRVAPALVEEEVFNIVRLGVQVVTNVRLGADLALSDLLERHDAAVLAMGCYDPNRIGIPGEDLPGVHTGLDFMMQVNEGRAPSIGKHVAVIGGGFTAMDCARMSLRMGAEDVSIYILTTEEDLLVTPEEVLETKREGISVVGLVSSEAILGEDRVEGLRFVRTRLGGVSERGERLAIPIEGSDFEVDADTVITAIGQRPEKTETRFDPGTGASDMDGLFAAGDFLNGASTVIEAIGNARQVAAGVDAYLMGRTRRQRMVTVAPAQDTHRPRAWDFMSRTHMPSVDLPDRLASTDAEVETGYTPDLAQTESQRCYLCNLRYEIHIPDCIYCRWCMEICPRDCIDLATGLGSGDGSRRGPILWTKRWNEVAGIVIDSDRCIRCGECLRVCPTQCIHVTRVHLTERLVTQEGVTYGG